MLSVMLELKLCYTTTVNAELDSCLLCAALVADYSCAANSENIMREQYS
jgi:hypothetical protein